MCIIVVKPRFMHMPDLSTLETCFINNPHGAGFMYNSHEHNLVHILKGFMTWDEFKRAITSKDLYHVDVVIHFRWATHGLVNEENCHPFPITRSVPELTATDLYTVTGFVHNGIISACTDPENKLSDSQVFVRDWLSYIPVPEIKKTDLYKLTYSKFALLDETGCTTFGNFIEDNGCLYSNDGYLPPKYVHPKTKSKKKNKKRTKEQGTYLSPDYERVMQEIADEWELYEYQVYKED